MMETTVTDYLQSNGIRFVIKPHMTPVFTCEDAARERKVRLSQIVKCMIGEDSSGSIHVALIPGDKILKLKKLRQVAGGKRIDLMDVEKIEQKLGLTTGAISPIQLMGMAEFYVDNSVLNEEQVDISSGDPSAGVEISSRDLVIMLNATRCDIISTSS